jgi:hypothetical protein
VARWPAFGGRSPRAVVTCATNGARGRRQRVPGGSRARDVPQHQARLDGCNDARTGVPVGMPTGAMCVQRFDDSLNSAIHITYRISLRSSSMPEPRDPLLKVLTDSRILRRTGLPCVWEGPSAAAQGVRAEATGRVDTGCGYGHAPDTR